MRFAISNTKQSFSVLDTYNYKLPVVAGVNNLISPNQRLYVLLNINLYVGFIY